MKRRRSKATRWAGARSPEQTFRDREWIQLPDGTRKRVAGYGRTRQAATDAMHDSIEREFARFRQGTDALVNTAMASLLRHKRTVKAVKRKTLHNDITLYRRHIEPSIGRKRLTAVTLEDLRALQSNLVDGKKYRTAELVTILLRSIWKHAVKTYRADIRAGLQLFNVAEDLEPIKRPASATKPKAEQWTEEQVGQFLAAAKARYEKSKKHLLYPYFHTAIAAGLRRGELLGLRRNALVARRVTVEGKTLDRHFLRVTEQLVYYDGRHHPDTPKSQSGTRDIPIGPELVAVLRAHMRKVDEVKRDNPGFNPKCDLMFPSFNGRPLEPRNIYRAWHQLLDELKLPDAVPHDLRGIYGTYVVKELVRQGTWSPKILQELLGHSTPDVGLRHYARVIEADYQGAIFDPSVAVGVTGGVIEEKEADAASEETAS